MSSGSRHVNTSELLLLVSALSVWLTGQGIVCAASGDRLTQQAADYRAEGVNYQRRGEWQNAMTAFQKAIQLDPSYVTPHNDLGIVYESQGRAAEAEQEYLAALALNPAYTQAHTNLALLYEQQGQKDKAGQHWMQRYQLGTDDDPWKRTAHDRLAALGYLAPEPAPQPTAAAPTTNVVPMTKHKLQSQAATSPVQVTAPIPSAEQRASADAFEHYDVILREFEEVTDPSGKTWGQRHYMTTTGTQAR